MKRRRILGTLGEEGGYLTCSMYVAHKKKPAYSIAPYSTFEAAVDALKRGEISLVLVPGAYPSISKFIMDKDIFVKKTFVKRIPPLVVATKKHTVLNCYTDFRKIYLHEATLCMIDELDLIKTIEIKKVTSNIDACKYMLHDQNCHCVAITNLLCANYFNAKIIKVIRKGIRMPWVIFAKKTNE